MTTEPKSEAMFHKAAELISAPRTDDPVVRIRPGMGYVDVCGKVGQLSTAVMASETGYVISGVCSNIDELALAETRVWLTHIEELTLED